MCSTSYTYEGGLVKPVTDPTGNTTYLEYGDPNVNNPTRVPDPKGGETLIQYDVAGNVTDVWVPGESHSAHMTYNFMGLVETVTNQLDATAEFDYKI